MENLGRSRIGSSGDMFSFPTPLGQDSDQPGSPADHLFLNGKLLPHSFPIQASSNFSSYSRSTSRTSSIGSKDSLMSSRSNSTNSRSSTCSSARTSTSEAGSERKLIMSSIEREQRRRERVKKPAVSSCHYHHYELFAAAPVLKQQGSRSSRKQTNVIEKKGHKKLSKGSVDRKKWIGWKILKLFVSACKECHAIKT